MPDMTRNQPAAGVSRRGLLTAGALVLAGAGCASAPSAVRSGVEKPELTVGAVGAVTAAGLYVAPFLTEAEIKYGAQPIADGDQGATASFPVSGYAVTTAWARRYPGTAAAFVRALSRGQQLADTSRPAVERVLPPYLGVTRQVASLVVTGDFPVGVNRGQIQRVAGMMHQFGMLAAPFDVATGIRAAVARLGRLLSALTRTTWRRPRLVVPRELEECGFGVIDWRALPSPVAVELLRAADRIARDGHAVAFTGRPYRTGPELTVDGRLTVVRYLSGQPGPAATPETASRRLIAILDGLVSGAHPIAVVSGQPELSQQDAAQAITRWQATLRPGVERPSIDIYGHDWTLHP